MKNCLSCVHCYFRPYERGYSELTPSSPLILECLKALWPDENNSIGDFGNKQQMGEALDTAEKCPEYSPEKWAK